MTKKLTNLLMLLTLCMSTCLFTACPGGDDVDDIGNISNSNKSVSGKKFAARQSDISVGDDYVGTYSWTFTIYFYSDTEGMVYEGKKSSYSDTGSTNRRRTAFFTYTVDGDGIDIDYITEEFSNCPSYLPISDGNVLYESLVLKESSIEGSDYTWINTLHGTTGSCKWYSNTAGALYIVGKGAMADYTSYASTPWAKNDPPSTVDVSDGVTHIGNYAFANINISTVDLPYSSLTSIGKYAFSGSIISTIRLSDNITSIGSFAFEGCENLTKVHMPNNIETVGAYAFSECKKATISFYGAKKVKTIGAYAFLGATVSSFNTQEALEEVGICAFTSMSESKLILPNTLTTLNAGCFTCSSLSEIRIGTGLKKVSGIAFSPAKTGKMYVSLGVPITLTNNIITEDCVKNWTLYVPKGSKAAYQKANYWKNFKSIVEDSSLESGNGTPDDSGDDSDDGDDSGNEETADYEGADYKPTYYYKINGETYKMITVEGGPTGTFRMMETELPVGSTIYVNGQYISCPVTSDQVVIKAVFREFLNKLRAATGTPFRLPRKEEWQYAAKGGNKSKGYTYSGSNSVDDVAWYKGNSNSALHSIATKKPNELGLYDMSGNYAEVCNDTNDLYYVDGPICGGSWNDAASSCTTTSWIAGVKGGKIPGTNHRHTNAFDGRYQTIRLVYTVHE